MGCRGLKEVVVCGQLKEERTDGGRNQKLYIFAEVSFRRLHVKTDTQNGFLHFRNFISDSLAALLRPHCRCACLPSFSSPFRIKLAD